MQHVFNAYSAYYDLIYKDKDYLKEAGYIIDLIKKHHNCANDIIEFGSGTGKHANLFSLGGFNVTGVEPSAEMIKIAQTKTKPNLSFVQASIESYYGQHTFDVALSLFHVISYLTDNEALKTAFKNVNNCLKKGGLFIFDVWYTPAVLTQLPEKRVKTIENDEIKLIRNAEPDINWNSNIVEVVYTIEVFNKLLHKTEYITETHKMRHFSIPELLLLAEVCGFEHLTTQEFLSGKTPGADTWGICIVLRKL
ncbi:class I SAM-dependent DNA methyltransferase [Pedobacter rhodius]|uniref:Class I SAM-dependent methyltransferase n=1 Tax=Pedobacter rhodius TaxID=3004098 RepID=A0ABT4KSB9_9SPHI|nr:class I SAM-dependent methyltransferase [Pedobacter sp. SJ11]MCZ4221824.1 class I SAM-dependent methyltransferase [Pedobacter sp. SJ11]